MNFKTRTEARNLITARKANGKFAELVDNGVNCVGSRWTVKIVG